MKIILPTKRPQITVPAHLTVSSRGKNSITIDVRFFWGFTLLYIDRTVYTYKKQRILDEVKQRFEKTSKWDKRIMGEIRRTYYGIARVKEWYICRRTEGLSLSCLKYGYAKTKKAASARLHRPRYRIPSE